MSDITILNKYDHVKGNRELRRSGLRKGNIPKENTQKIKAPRSLGKDAKYSYIKTKLLPCIVHKGTDEEQELVDMCMPGFIPQYEEQIKTAATMKTLAEVFHVLVMNDASTLSEYIYHRLKDNLTITEFLKNVAPEDENNSIYDYLISDITVAGRDVALAVYFYSFKNAKAISIMSELGKIIDAAQPLTLITENETAIKGLLNILDEMPDDEFIKAVTLPVRNPDDSSLITYFDEIVIQAAETLNNISMLSYFGNIDNVQPNGNRLRIRFQVKPTLLGGYSYGMLGAQIEFNTQEIFAEYCDGDGYKLGFDEAIGPILSSLADPEDGEKMLQAVYNIAYTSVKNYNLTEFAYYAHMIKMTLMLDLLFLSLKQGHELYKNNTLYYFYTSWMLNQLNCLVAFYTYQSKPTTGIKNIYCPTVHKEDISTDALYFSTEMQRRSTIIGMTEATEQLHLDNLNFDLVELDLPDLVSALIGPKLNRASLDESKVEVIQEAIIEDEIEQLVKIAERLGINDILEDDPNATWLKAYNKSFEYDGIRIIDSYVPVVVNLYGFRLIALLDKVLDTNIIDNIIDICYSQLNTSRIDPATILNSLNTQIASAVKKLRKHIITLIQNDAKQAELEERRKKEEERQKQLEEKRAKEEAERLAKEAEEQARREAEQQKVEAERQKQIEEQQRLEAECRAQEEKEAQELAELEAQLAELNAQEEAQKAKEAAEREANLQELGANYVRRLVEGTTERQKIVLSKQQMRDLNDELYVAIFEKYEKIIKDVVNNSDTLYNIYDISALSKRRLQPDKLKRKIMSDTVNWDEVNILEYIEDMFAEDWLKHADEVVDPLDFQRLSSKKKMCSKHGVDTIYYDKVISKFKKAETAIDPKSTLTENYALSLHTADLDKIAKLYHAKKVRYNFDGQYAIFSKNDDMILVNYTTIVKLLKQHK